VKRWLFGLSAILVLAVSALALWRSSSLIIERTIIAELPLGINTLVPTDLDGDGEPEILAVCSHWQEIQPTWFIPDYERIADPRIWLIRSPLEKPNAAQLPYVCRWRNLDLPSSLPPQRSVLVEEGELLSLGLRKGWKVHRLGWLKMIGKQLTFEPFLTVKGQITHYLIADDKLLLLHYTRPFAFCLQPDGVWKPVDQKIAQRLLRIDRLDYLDGDFDGDGLKDAITRRWLRSGNKTKAGLDVYWGNGAPATVLLKEIPPKLLPMRIRTADIEGDGRWEIVTWDGKDLTVWQFRKHDRRFVPMTRMALKPPIVAPKRVWLPLIAATVPPPPAMVEPVFASIDLNGDGRKEFLLFWKENLFKMCGLDPSPPKNVSVQVIWQQGGKMRVRQFDPKKIPLPNIPITTWTQNGLRFALACETYERKLFRPRLISFRPLRLQWWETVQEMRSVLLQLPNGDEALDLRRWLKIAEFPAFPMLSGDWDNDGRMELLLLRRFWESLPQLPHWWMGKHSLPRPDHEILYLVQHDGRKVRWAKILPLSSARALHALPLKGRNGAAVFIAWQLEDKVVVERLRWR
jgi:hypothetical protein